MERGNVQSGPGAEPTTPRLLWKSGELTVPSEEIAHLLGVWSKNMDHPIYGRGVAFMLNRYEEKTPPIRFELYPEISWLRLQVPNFADEYQTREYRMLRIVAYPNTIECTTGSAGAGTTAVKFFTNGDLEEHHFPKEFARKKQLPKVQNEPLIPPDEKTSLSVTKAAELLDCTPDNVRQLLKAKKPKLQGEKHGREWFVTAESVANYQRKMPRK